MKGNTYKNIATQYNEEFLVWSVEGGFVKGKSSENWLGMMSSCPKEVPIDEFNRDYRIIN